MVVLNAGIYLLLTVASHYQQLVNVPFEIDRDRPEVKHLLPPESARRVVSGAHWFNFAPRRNASPQVHQTAEMA